MRGKKSPKQQAGIEGLGWGWWNRNIKGTWNAAFSCQHYEERLNESIARTRPLENQLTEQNTTLTNLKSTAIARKSRYTAQCRSNPRKKQLRKNKNC